MRGGRLGFVLILALGCLLANGRPAGADQLVLANGDILSGNLELSELVVMTQEGAPLRIGRQDVLRASLGTATGDVVLLRNGRTVVGLVDQPRYTIRLASGQTVVVGRHQVGTLTVR